MMRRRIALGSAGAFIALAVCVHLGLTQALDSTLRDWVRPHDAWGTAQMRADLVVQGLRPAVVAALLTAFTVVCCMRLRSLRPAMFVGSVSLLTVVLTLATKAAVGRPDPHGQLATGHGGSFPSGHVVGAVICLGLALQIVQPSASRWVWLIPAIGGGLMGACLLLEAAHWPTDIVGGGLLAAGVLAKARAPTSWWRAESRGSPENSPTRSSATVTLLRRKVFRSYGG
jgi:membrane-associated phospholipid phosphatase